MKEDEAKRLIRSTFENQFDENNFKRFIAEVLKRVDGSKEFFSSKISVHSEFENYVNNYKRIGQYKTDKQEIIDVLIVYLKNETTLERARSAQRNFIRWYLNGGKDNKLRDAALVAFVVKGSDNWRFSFVKMQYSIGQNGKIKDDTTPAKRYSFIVGKNESSHTAQSRFLQLLTLDKEPSLAEIEDAFNAERVTDEFFDRYKVLFIKTVDEIEKIKETTSTIKNEFNSKNISTVDFGKKLLGQIVFIYFLQKKGWLGVEKGKPWGSGSKQFLRDLFEKSKAKEKNFFNSYLKYLFYDALNNERSNQADPSYYEYLDCRIPFLNGGLFEPYKDYDWKNIDLMIPNELFSNQSKDGILDVFDLFNFTVKEDEPLEKEVAVDPELLGKIYEKLNAIREDNFEEYKKAAKGKESEFNKKYGVYYTPREIVHFMAQSVLVEYLYDNLKSQKQESENLKESIEHFIFNSDKFSGNDLKALETLEKKEEQKNSKISAFIKENAKPIDNLLENVKIIDPAVGSGAFPIGLMHEIVKAREILHNLYFKDTKKTAYDFKSHCIQNSLYGVDIDSGAVEITRLRFWLSLVVDEEDLTQIKPLPNLDYKLVVGDSLGQGINVGLANIKSLEKLDYLTDKYPTITNFEEKKKLKQEIDKIINKLTGDKKEFDYYVYFSKIMRNGGFNIVIGNPPHGADISRYKKDYIENNFSFFETRKNSASLFIEKGIKLLKPEGILAYVIPKSITFVESWEKTRKFVYKHNKLIVLIDITKAFENVKLEQVILINKKAKMGSYFYRAGDFWDKKIKINTKIKTEVADELETIPIYTDEIKLNILKKLLGGSVKLYSISKTFRGLPYQNKISGDGYPILRGRNLNKYMIYREIDKINIPESDFNKLKIKRLMIPKIISQNIVAHIMNPFDRITIMATYDKKGFLTLDTVMNTFLTDKSFSYEYILGILNSRLAEWFYYWFVYNRAIRTMHFDESYIGKLPIKKITSQNQHIADQISELVSKTLAIAQSRGYVNNQQKQIKVFEKQINSLVYQLYDMTEDEIKIIDVGPNG